MCDGWRAQRRHGRGAVRAYRLGGGANNQLAHACREKLLADRGILYAPDYLVNAGGVIQVADELAWRQRGAGPGWRGTDLHVRLKDLRARRRKQGVPPAVAADRLAERRMSEVGRLRGIWLSSGPTSDRLLAAA